MTNSAHLASPCLPCLHLIVWEDLANILSMSHQVILVILRESYKRFVIINRLRWWTLYIRTFSIADWLICRGCRRTTLRNSNRTWSTFEMVDPAISPCLVCMSCILPRINDPGSSENLMSSPYHLLKLLVNFVSPQLPTLKPTRFNPIPQHSVIFGCERDPFASGRLYG